jgi:hypothetical protein
MIIKQPEVWRNLRLGNAILFILLTLLLITSEYYTNTYAMIFGLITIIIICI